MVGSGCICLKFFWGIVVTVIRFILAIHLGIEEGGKKDLFGASVSQV